MRSGGPRKLSTCSRRAAPPGRDWQHDPALTLLGALVADVDTPGTATEPGVPGLDDLQAARARAGWPQRAAGQRAGAWPALAAPSRGAAGWLRAAVAGGLVAGLASITSLLATSMLARLTRGPPEAAGGSRGTSGRAGCADHPARGQPTVAGHPGAAATPLDW